MGARVLDVGTGAGQVAAAIAQRGGNPAGIDFSEAMLEEARSREPGIDFRLASAEALPFANEEFDAVVGNFVLDSVYRLGGFDEAGSVRAVLRSDGTPGARG